MQCQIREVVFQGTLSSSQSNYKGKKYFGIAEESIKDAYTTTICLSEMNLKKQHRTFS